MNERIEAEQRKLEKLERCLSERQSRLGYDIECARIKGLIYNTKKKIEYLENRFTPNNDHNDLEKQRKTLNRMMQNGFTFQPH